MIKTQSGLQYEKIREGTGPNKCSALWLCGWTYSGPGPSQATEASFCLARQNGKCCKAPSCSTLKLYVPMSQSGACSAAVSASCSGGSMEGIVNQNLYRTGTIQVSHRED